MKEGLMDTAATILVVDDEVKILQVVQLQADPGLPCLISPACPVQIIAEHQACKSANQNSHHWINHQNHYISECEQGTQGGL